MINNMKRMGIDMDEKMEGEFIRILRCVEFKKWKNGVCERDDIRDKYRRKKRKWFR